MNKRTVQNGRKLRSMGTLGVVGFLMLFQYQNCAPAAKSVQASDDGIMTTIDNVNATTAVQFQQAKVKVGNSTQPILVDGLCSSQQDGAVLGWKVHDSQGRLRETGYAECTQSHFEVQMAPANELDCDQSYLLSAQLASGTTAAVEVHRDCSVAAADSN